MNKQLQKHAADIFRDNWSKSKMQISHKEFIEGFPTLYNTQIIPSLVQALEFRKQFETEQSDIDAIRFSKELGIPPEIIKMNPAYRESKIQPGQKLKDGDYVKCSRSQVSELIEIENSTDFEHDVKGVVYDGDDLMPINIGWCKEVTEYEFEDFKQLCINTFGDGK